MFHNNVISLLQSTTQATKLFSTLILVLASSLCGYLYKVFDLMAHSEGLCLIAGPRVCKTEQTAFTFT